MNIHNNDAFARSVGQIPASQQSEQSMLLDAIKNKFANNNLSDTSASVFSIPNLKLPQFATENPLGNTKTESKLNQFILGQLSESKTTNNGGNFVIPNLQALSKTNGKTVTLAEKLHLKSVESEQSIDSLKSGFKDLQVRDDKKSHIIDLTTALNRQSINTPSPSKQQANLTTPNPVDFNIPFIDCDLREAAQQLPSRDKYCQLDVSGFVNNRYIAAPSKFGKITCLRYRLPKRLHCIHHSFSPKHEIIRFDFRTKSPDDIILSSLRKINKV